VRWTEEREQFGWDENLDAARHPGLPSNEAGAFKGEHHLMDRGRGDTEVPLHVGFRGRAAVHAHIGVDEGQVLPLLGREVRRSLVPLGVAAGLLRHDADFWLRERAVRDSSYE
jgi:hypothetical protein